METPNNNPNQTRVNQPSKDGGNNPKLPNNDPDQTPSKEVQNVPAANPNKGNQTSTPQKTKIGFNK